MDIPENPKFDHHPKPGVNPFARANGGKGMGGNKLKRDPKYRNETTWLPSDAQRRVDELRAMLATRAPAILDKLMTMAEAGDVLAARVVVERLIPMHKPVEVPVNLNLEVNSSADRAEAVFQAIVDGKLGVEQGSRLLAALAAAQEVAVNAAFQQRIAGLEQQALALRNGKNNIEAPAAIDRWLSGDTTRDADPSE